MSLMPGVPRSTSRLCFSEYYELEKGNKGSSVTSVGSLLEHSVYELRVAPPTIEIKAEDRFTQVSVFSANRAGTLVEVRGPGHWHPPAGELGVLGVRAPPGTLVLTRPCGFCASLASESKRCLPGAFAGSP